MPANTSQRFPDFHGTSLWAKLPLQADVPLFDADDTLKLSATGMGNYMTCPRRFFYSQMLQLPSESTPASQLGLIVHQLMEGFNQAYSQDPVTFPYTPGTLRRLSNAFFQRDTTYFEEDTLEQLDNLTETQLMDLKKRWLASIDDLERQGYFDPTPEKVVAEQSFAYHHPQLNRCTLTGKIDALIQQQRPSQQPGWQVVDYKYFGPHAFTASEKTRQNHLMTALSPLAEEPDHPHNQRFKDKDNRNYQIPLYYWATQHDKTIRALVDSPVTSVGLQIIRPAIVGDKGAITISIPAEILAEQTDTVVADIQQHFVDPILAAHNLEKLPGKDCDTCLYRTICDGWSEAQGIPEGETP